LIQRRQRRFESFGFRRLSCRQHLRHPLCLYLHQTLFHQLHQFLCCRDLLFDPQRRQ
jgi:hypothetical protein